MGFDLYGVKPKLKQGSVKPERPDWNNCTEAEKDEYYFGDTVNVRVIYDGR